jgi:hypothetical protein
MWRASKPLRCEGHESSIELYDCKKNNPERKLAAKPSFTSACSSIEIAMTLGKQVYNVSSQRRTNANNQEFQ